MRRIIPIVLLFVFVVHSTQKVVVLLDFYANKSFIEKNLCENRFEKIPVCKGQCYLTKELRKVDKHEQKLPASKWKEEILFFQVNILDYLINSINFSEESKHYFYYKSNIYFTNYFQIFHPPQSIV